MKNSRHVFNFRLVNAFSEAGLIGVPGARATPRPRSASGSGSGGGTALAESRQVVLVNQQSIAEDPAGRRRAPPLT